MDLDEFLEKDIINYLNSKVERKQTSMIEREEEYGLYISRDYIKELNQALDRDELSNAKKLFDELKGKYNDLPSNSVERKKLYTMLEQMYSKIEAYINMKEGSRPIQYNVPETLVFSRTGEFKASYQPATQKKYAHTRPAVENPFDAAKPQIIREIVQQPSVSTPIIAQKVELYTVDNYTVDKDYVKNSRDISSKSQRSGIRSAKPEVTEKNIGAMPGQPIEEDILPQMPQLPEQPKASAKPKERESPKPTAMPKEQTTTKRVEISQSAIKPEIKSDIKSETNSEIKPKIEPKTMDLQPIKIPAPVKPDFTKDRSIMLNDMINRSARKETNKPAHRYTEETDNGKEDDIANEITPIPSKIQPEIIPVPASVAAAAAPRAEKPLTSAASLPLVKPIASQTVLQPVKTVLSPTIATALKPVAIPIASPVMKPVVSPVASHIVSSSDNKQKDRIQERLKRNLEKPMQSMIDMTAKDKSVDTNVPHIGKIIDKNIPANILVNEQVNIPVSEKRDAPSAIQEDETFDYFKDQPSENELFKADSLEPAKAPEPMPSSITDSRLPRLSVHMKPLPKEHLPRMSDPQPHESHIQKRAITRALIGQTSIKTSSQTSIDLNNEKRSRKNLERLYELGLKSMFQNDIVQASKIFEKIIDMRPKHMAARIRLQQCQEVKQNA